MTIYNEAYKPMASEKHPKLMGSTFKQAWPEVYDKFSFIFANAQLMGQAPSMEHSCFFVERHGYLEECVSSVSRTVEYHLCGFGCSNNAQVCSNDFCRVVVSSLSTWLVDVECYLLHDLTLPLIIVRWLKYLH